MLCAQAWKPSSQHAGEKRGVAGLLLGRTERTNKASGGDGIPVELFQILKDDAVKVLHSICQQIWKVATGLDTPRVKSQED